MIEALGHSSSPNFPLTKINKINKYIKNTQVGWAWTMSLALKIEKKKEKSTKGL